MGWLIMRLPGTLKLLWQAGKRAGIRVLRLTELPTPECAHMNDMASIQNPKQFQCHRFGTPHLQLARWSAL